MSHKGSLPLNPHQSASTIVFIMTGEMQTLTRACGKSDVHPLEPEDLRALSLEASLIAGLPLAGIHRVFDGGPGWLPA